MSLNEYGFLFKDFIREFYTNLFDYCVRLAWLRRQFSYAGQKNKYPFNHNSFTVGEAFAKFVRRVVGVDLKIIFRSPFFSAVDSFMEDFFPDFEYGNPFENLEYYKFPYKHITIDFLPVVYQMDDRLQLLQLAEDKCMSFADFQDYVLNHSYSSNDELGRIKYEINQKSRHNSFRITNVDKKF